MSARATPSSREEALACYAELVATVRRMVELARERRWEALPALDAHCTGVVDQLKHLDAGELDAPARSQLAALAGRIRADQDELERLVRPQFLHLVQRMAELQQAP